jgi:phage terminase small subunit
MPRKSAAAIDIEHLAKRNEPKGLRARSALSPEVKLLWTELVSSMPHSHFRDSDAPLIEQYCQAIALARQAYAHLNEEGSVVSGRANAWLVVLEKAHRSSVALSMRLRLSPQSRLDRKAVKDGGPVSAYQLMRMQQDDDE